jgi:hypothetical protein
MLLGQNSLWDREGARNLFGAAPRSASPALGPRGAQLRVQTSPAQREAGSRPEEEGEKGLRAHAREMRSSRMD